MASSIPLSAETGRPPLGARRIAVLAVAGAILWFLAAMLVRAIGPLGAYRGIGTPLLYALVVPGTAGLILIGRRLAGLPRDRILLGVAIVTAAASLLDGTALAWFPALYGPNAVGAAAAILWGVGVGLVLAIALNGLGQA